MARRASTDQGREKTRPKRAPKTPKPAKPKRTGLRAFGGRREKLPAPPLPLGAYTVDPDLQRRGLRRLAMPIGVVMFCLFYGLLFAFFSPYLILQFTIPIIFLAVLAIWALPDGPKAPVTLLWLLFYAFYITMVCWPGYLAIALPGLPWITLARLTGFPLLFTLLLCISLSPDFRAKLGGALKATPWIWRLLMAFVAIQTLSIVMSKEISTSIDKYIVAQVTWTSIFFVSVYLFLKPGRAERWAAALWIMGIVVGLIAVDEYRHQVLPWVGHIPRFLAIDDPVVQNILSGKARGGVYRAQSTFTTSLGLSEYIALTLPFVFRFAAGPYRLWVRLAAFASIPFLFVIVTLTNSRLGIVGCLLTALLYPLFWAMLEWRRNKASIFGPAITLAFPAIVLLTMAATFFIGRLHAMVWGSGAQQASTDSRIDQYKRGLPLILKNPIGHGIGTAADTLDYHNLNGDLTIDTYYLAILLEYGIIGFFVYYGMLAMTIYYAGKTVVVTQTKDRDLAFLVPVAISLVNFFIIKSVFSQQDNHPLVFMMMGIVVALVFRARNSASSRADAEANLPPHGRLDVSQLSTLVRKHASAQP